MSNPFGPDPLDDADSLDDVELDGEDDEEEDDEGSFFDEDDEDDFGLSDFEE